MSHRFPLGVLALLGALGACSSQPGKGTSGSSATGGSAASGAGGATGSTSTASSASSTSSTSTTSSSTATSSSSSSGMVDAGPSDGTPVRKTCTGNFGTALSATHGRMDGYLVSVIAPGGGQGCNGDSGHVHLQVEMNGAVYDVAVNTDTLYDQIDAPLPGAPWTEGWHAGDALDYPSNLGVHSGSFTTTTPAAIAQTIAADLAAANHVSIFATAYGPTGAHDVHRRGSGEDGAIVTNPLSPKAHLMLFRFSTDSF